MLYIPAASHIVSCLLIFSYLLGILCHASSMTVSTPTHFFQPHIPLCPELTLCQPMTHIHVMSSRKPIRIYMEGFILGVNTLYRLFCFFKLFPIGGKSLNLFFCDQNKIPHSHGIPTCLLMTTPTLKPTPVSSPTTASPQSSPATPSRGTPQFPNASPYQFLPHTADRPLDTSLTLNPHPK